MTSDTRLIFINVAWNGNPISWHFATWGHKTDVPCSCQGSSLFPSGNMWWNWTWWRAISYYKWGCWWPDETISGTGRTCSSLDLKQVIQSLSLKQPVLGKLVQRPAKLDENLAEELKSLSTQDDPFETHVGRTMCTYDFYEGTYEIWFNL